MRMLIFIALSIVSSVAFSDQSKTMRFVCVSVTNPNSEIHLRVINHQLDAVSFVKGNWSQDGGPYFNVIYSELGSGPLYARYNKVNKETAFIQVERKLLNDASSGIVVTDEIPYECNLK